jgi:predicted nucleic acid-binding Zn ribbon protein
VRKRRVPRRAGSAVGALVDGLAPASGLAALQRVWPGAVGELVAQQAHPTAERDGVVVVTCSSSVWAQELTLMAPDLIARIKAAPGAPQVSELRCRAVPAGAWARGRSS